MRATAVQVGEQERDALVETICCLLVHEGRMLGMPKNVDKGVSHDSEWLKQKLITLLESASESEEPDHAACAKYPDHAACAKYADLLWKMLPKGGKEPSAKVMAMVEGQLP